MEARIEAEARKLEAQTQQLCDQLPHLLETQQALAAAVPEFAPYARMTVDDIKDCRESARDTADTGTADSGPAHGHLDPAAEADAAAATGAASAAPATGRSAGPADPTR